MKTNTTTAAKLLEVSRQLGLSLPEVMLRRERELQALLPKRFRTQHIPLRFLPTAKKTLLPM